MLNRADYDCTLKTQCVLAMQPVAARPAGFSVWRNLHHGVLQVQVALAVAAQQQHQQQHAHSKGGHHGSMAGPAMATLHGGPGSDVKAASVRFCQQCSHAHGSHDFPPDPQQPDGMSRLCRHCLTCVHCVPNFPV